MANVCNVCNKNYKSSKSLWNHHSKYHDKHSDKHDKHNDKHDKHSTLKSYECEKCGKMFKHYQSRWRHQQTCESNINNKISTINEIEIIKKEIESLKKKSLGNTTINNIKNINKGVINKGVINNGTINFSMNKTGFESLEILSDKEIEYIFNQEMNSIISLIEFLNFDEAHPENHTFCTTALNDKYVSTINTETFTIEKQRKTDFYDNLINRGICNMKLLFDRLKVMKTKKLSNCENKIKQLIDFLVVNKKGKKACVELINALSFNKRHITQSTWFDIIQGNIPIKPQIININEDELDKSEDILQKKNITSRSNHKLLLKHHFDSDTDTENIDLENFDLDYRKDDNNREDCEKEDDSDCEKEDEDCEKEDDDNSEKEDDDEVNDDPIFPKIEYKGQTYILDGNLLFTIDLNGKKLRQYGTFIKGRVKKIKNLIYKIILMDN